MTYVSDRRFMLINGVPVCQSEEWIKQRGNVVTGIGRITDINFTKLGALAMLVICSNQVNPPEGLLPESIARLVVETCFKGVEVKFVSEAEHDKLIQ